MRNVCWRVGVVGCVIGLFVADVEAQRTTVSVRPVAGTVRRECVGGPDAGLACTSTADCENDGGGVMHPACQRLCDGDPAFPCLRSSDCPVSGSVCEQRCFCNSVVPISNPGLPILSEIWVSNWGTRRAAGWQIQADFTPIADAVLPRGWDRPLDEDILCEDAGDCTTRYPVCGATGVCQGSAHNPCQGAFVCAQCAAPGVCARSDYIFYQCPELGASDYSTLNYQIARTTLELGCQRPFTVPRYLATLIVQPTAAACGDVTLNVVGTPYTGLSDPDSMFIEPLDIEGFTLEFGPCQCTGILESDPPDCAVDARQTSGPSGTPAQGIQSIALNLEGPATDSKCPSTVGLLPSDFTMRRVPGITTFNPNSVTHDTPEPGWITLNFPAATPDRWTCVSFGASPNGPDEVCFGYLPGDVDGDLVSLASDIPYLIDCITGDETCALYQCDIDRSGMCGASDILREIDLLNGATPYLDWLNETLPACP